MKKAAIILAFLTLLLSNAYSTTAVINAFNSGELSPLLEGRTDIKKYYSGCRIVENMVVMPHGGITKRPGSAYIASAKDPNTACRLIPFEFSVEQAYIIEMGHQYLRFYKDGGQITDDDDDPYEIASPYDSDDISTIQFIQSADTMYFAHPSYKPRSLTRTGHTSWTLDIIEFERGPFLDEYVCPQAVITSGPLSLATSSNGGVASESGGVGTASGTVAATNDDDITTFRRRTDTGSTGISGGDLYNQFTIDISLGTTVEELERIVYNIAWVRTTSGVDIRREYKIATSSIKQNDVWTAVGSSTSNTSTIYGPWNNVTDIRLALVQSVTYQAKVSPKPVSASVTLFELEAFGTSATTETCVTVTPSNTKTYDRILTASAAADQGGTPNIVRIPSAAHGFLAGDYVIISETTNYNGLFEITNVDSVNTFDIASAYNAETFAGTETASSRVTLTASDDLWNANHVGALWQITHTVAASEVASSFTGNASSSEQTVQLGRGYDYNLDGVWTGTALLQRSYNDGSSWKDVYSFTKLSTNQPGLSYADNETVDDAIYRVTMTNFGGTSCSYSFTALSFDLHGVVAITSYNSATEVLGTVEYELGGITAVDTWAEGAWSDDEGYPSAITFFEERQVYAATTNSAQTIWMSQTDDWDNFLLGTGATDAITLTIAADQVNSIRWMLPQTALLVGTVGGEWKIGTTNTDEPFSTGNKEAKKQSNYGSANIQALSVGNLIIYVQRQSQKIRKLTYSFELDNWIAPDLTLLSEHITGDGVTALAFQKNPYSILWMVREDGALLSLTLEESQEVIGWTRHGFDGVVESVAVIPGDNEDEVWISVKRTINDILVRYVEQIQSFDWGDDQEDCFFVDSGLTFDGGDAIVITDITQANPGVVTAVAHGFSDGDQVRFYDVNGMTKANQTVYTVSNPATDTFELRDPLDEVDVDTRGLFAYWKMDDNAADTVVTDELEGNNAASYYNTEIITVEGKLDSGFTLDGIDGIVTIPDDDVFSFGDGSNDEPFSISLWVKPALTGIGTTLIDKSAQGIDDLEYFLHLASGFPEFRLIDDSEGSLIFRNTSTTAITAGAWTHVVATYDGSEAREGLAIYFDGVQVDDTNGSVGAYTAMENLDNDIIVGDKEGSGTDEVVMDNLMFHNKELSVFDIAELYNSGLGNARPSGYHAYIDGGFVRQCENTFTTLAHLQGETVAVLQDGGDAGTKTVISGTIRTDDFYYVVHAGLPFSARILPMKLELAGSPGALFGQTKRITEVTLRFYKTAGCDVGTSWIVFESMIFHRVATPLDVAPELLTDDVEIDFDGPYETAGNIYIQSDVPLPLTLLAMMSRFEVME